jgi:hypothetical protein
MDEQTRTPKQMDAAFGASTASKIALWVDDALWIKREKLWHRIDGEPPTCKDGRVRVVLRGT